MDDEFFYKAIRRALDAVAAAGEDPERLEEPLRTVVIVHSAQGLIGNGGLQYFFECDFPGRPPYSVFVDAFERIGAQDAASRLKAAVDLFPFSDPHLDVTSRQEFLDACANAAPESSASQLEALSDLMCVDVSVWDRLREYVYKHSLYFGAA